MFNEMMMIDLNEMRRNACERRGAQERLLNQVFGQRAMACRVCEILGSLFMKLGKSLISISRNRFSDGQPASDSDWYRIFAVRSQYTNFA